MKFLWILGFVSALRVPVGDFLFEKQKILDKFRFPRNSRNQGIRPEMPRHLGNVSRVVSPGGKFVFELGSGESPQQVHELKTALQIASGFIENGLLFNTQIKVHVNHGNYYAGVGVQGKYQPPSKIGLCQPVKYKEAGKGGVRPDYPQALEIQKGASRSKTHDAEMFVKACDNCVYPGSYGEDKQSIDIVDIIIHELSHGLGFTSNFASGSMCGPGGLIIWTGFAGGYPFKYIPESLFDTHLYTNETSLHAKLQELHSPPSSNQLNTNDICSHTTVSELIRLLATPNSIYFKTTKGSHVYVETGPNVGGGRASHIDTKKYHMTQDSLMIPYATMHGHTLKNFTRPEDWSTAPLGKLTLEVFETLGYTVNLNPDPNRSQLALYLQMKKHLFNHS
ncbi:hypothetical protein DSO57_1001080 [Entomophthora muscae]|uniref:Uncharacterized protein n=1 Tax=Entomophthora muscae TaxID=34485 RepID=A0ACC2SAW0_9FUNG|nr:hypothetical protein DSO57_1001080 [Entomophthora muscae]